MRYILLFFFLFNYGVRLYSQVFVSEKKYKNHLEEARLSGKVKSVKDISFSRGYRVPVDSSVDKPVVDYYVLTEYNVYGNIIAKKTMRPDNSVARVEEYYYNNNQQLVELIGYNPGNEGSKTNKLFYYNNDNNLVSEKFKMYRDNIILLSRAFEYDAAKRMIAVREYNIIEGDSSFIYLKYNHYGLVSVKSYESKKGTSENLYVYNDKFQLLQYKSYYTNRNKPGTDSSMTVYEYDKMGTMISSTFFKESSAFPWSSPHKEENEYDYDSSNNWIKRLRVSKKNDGTRFVAEERIITYY